MTSGYELDIHIPGGTECKLAIFNYGYINRYTQLPICNINNYIVKHLVGVWKIKKLKNK